MKRILLSILCFTVLQSTFSQDNLEKKRSKVYVSFETGFTFPVAKSTVGSPRPEVGDLLLIENLETGEYSKKNSFSTRGAGFVAGASVGYMFIDNFGIELELSYLRTQKIIDAKRDETATNGSRYFAEQYSYTNMFRAAPLLVVSANSNRKFSPYAKFGLLIPLAGKTTVEVDINDETGEVADNTLHLLDKELHDLIVDNGLSAIRIPTQTSIVAKTSGHFSVGFAAHFGVDYHINEHWSLNADMEMKMLTVKANETEFVEFKSTPDATLIASAEHILGLEEGSLKRSYILEDLPEILRLTVYEDEITEDSNYKYEYQRRNEPYNQVTFRDSYNSFGFAIGLKYKF